MPQGRLMLPALVLALSAQAAEIPRGGDLGKRWKAREWTPAVQLSGQWVRRGESNVFDVQYKDSSRNKELLWQLTVVSVRGQDVRMRATLNLGSGPRTYDVTGRILSDGRTIRGKGGWCTKQGAYCGFEAVADWNTSLPVAKAAAGTSQPARTAGEADPPAAAAKMGQLWRVRDNTAGGYEWVGTWSFQGESVRFSYRNRTGREKAEGVMQLIRWDGARIVIRDGGARRTYEGTVQADGRTVKGTSPSCEGRKGCGWEAVIEK